MAVKLVSLMDIFPGEFRLLLDPQHFELTESAMKKALCP